MSPSLYSSFEDHMAQFEHFLFNDPGHNRRFDCLHWFSAARCTTLQGSVRVLSGHVRLSMCALY